MASSGDLEKNAVAEKKRVISSKSEPFPTPSCTIASDPEARPSCFSSTFQEILFVTTCTMAIGISSFTIGSISVITAVIGHSLNMTNAEITWINAAFSLAAGSFLLFFARVADLFGRRSMFILSLGLYSVLVVVAGFAKNAVTMDLLMGLTGLMSAAAVPPAQGLLGVIYNQPSKRKNMVLACFSAGNPLGFVFGMVSSGVATKVLSWRASFWWLGILYAVFTIVAILAVPNDPTEKQELNWETVGNFDIPGTILTIAGIAMFSGALSLGGNAPQGWKTPYVLALFIISVVCIIVFIVWECHVANPLLPLWIFKDRNFFLLLSMLLLGFQAFSSAEFWASLYFQRVWGASALKTAVYLLPMAVMGTLVNIVAGLILHRVSNKLLMGVGAFAYTVSFLFFAVAKTHISYWALFFPGLTFMVVGADFEFNVANMYVMSTMSEREQSVAGGLFQTVTRMCTTIGFGISTAAFNAVQAHPSNSGYYAGDPIEPYAATFWFFICICCGKFAFASLGYRRHARSSYGEQIVGREIGLNFARRRFS